MERFPYRYVEDGIIEHNGKPDYRIQKFNEYTRRYNDMYYLDNENQLDACLEDFEYTKWLDPAGVSCYNKKEVENYQIIMNPIDTNRIANALERIATALEHFNIEHAHIDEIDHNHVEGDVNTHAKTW